MAGDRRATSGNLISHRTMEKVFPADRHSGVAIAGAAGPAMEMVKLFQLQLEHYEKVEGTPLSLEGKANQLSMMVRGNLPAAMQGMVVVPIFAGFDDAARPGAPVQLRRHRRPVRGAGPGGHRLGQPARRHRHQGRLPGRPGPRRGRGPLRSGAVGGGRRRLGHRRPGPAAGHLPRRGDHHRRRASSECSRRRARRPLRGSVARRCSRRRPRRTSKRSAAQ